MNAPHTQRLRLRPGRRLAAALLASAASVAAVTGLIEGLKTVAPVLSLGVLYVAAVLPVAVLFGVGFGVLVAVASMVAFNWFHLPPTHSFSLRESENWVALAVYLATAVVVSALAARSRVRARLAEQQGREAAALATAATALLVHASLPDALDAAAAGAAAALRLPGARIELGPARSPRPDEAPFRLEADGRQIGILAVPAGSAPDPGAVARLLPALASQLAVAADRERLAAEALEAETLRRSDAVKTAVIQAVSHDLRTPLATIETAFGGLEGGLHLDPADRSELVETVRSELARLERLIDNLLDLSRLQAGAAIGRPELWTADQLLAQAFDEVPGSDRCDVQLPEGLAVVSVDAAQLQRVLVNLLDNALRYSPPGERVLVRVAATRHELVFHVIDHGPGIAADELERIFSPFHQAAGTPRGRGGAGLGLAIARGFAEANGGRVWAESRPGQGSTLALALPLVDAPLAAEVQA